MADPLPDGFMDLDDLWDDSPAETDRTVPGNPVHDGSAVDADQADDSRLYLPGWDEGWRVQLKTTWDREYCFAKNPGEEFYHLLMAGEVYVTYDEEKYCLECARRRGVISPDRLYWKRGGE